jgi:hypothetical protein
MGKKQRALMVANPPVSSSSEEEDSDASDVEKQPEPLKSKSALESEKSLKSKPAPESSEETEEGSSEEETDDEEEKSKPVAPAAKTSVPEPATPEASTESEAGDESGSDDDSAVDTKSPSASAFTIKPASKPISDSKQQDPKSTPTKVAGKRASESHLNGKDSKVKKSKVSNKEEEAEDPKTEERKIGGPRLWTEKDETALLNGLIRYKSEKGPDPDLSLFPEFLKGSIRADFSKGQLLDKMRRLRKKYLTYLEKSGNGEDPVFSKQHESVLFDLSKKIWNSAGKLTNTGDENGVTNNITPKKSKKTEIKKIVPKEDIKTIVAADEPKAKASDEEEKGLDFAFLGLDEMFKFPNMSAEESKKYFEKNLGLIGGSKAKEMNDKWKKLQIEEFEVYSKKMSLISEMSRVMLDAFKSSKN